MFRPMFRIGAGCALAVTALSAAEVDAFLDLRGGVQFTEADYERVREGRDDVDGDWEAAYNLSATALASRGLGVLGGFVFGAGAVGCFREDEADDIDVEYQSLTLCGYAGYAFAVTPALQIEVLPFVGVGYAELEEIEPSSTSPRPTPCPWVRGRSTWRSTTAPVRLTWRSRPASAPDRRAATAGPSTDPPTTTRCRSNSCCRPPAPAGSRL